jgi:hypothetical protein
MKPPHPLPSDATPYHHTSTSVFDCFHYVARIQGLSRLHSGILTPIQLEEHEYGLIGENNVLPIVNFPINVLSCPSLAFDHIGQGNPGFGLMNTRDKSILM